MRVRLLSQGRLRGDLNMAVDEAILSSRATTLRFYQWEPPCLSLGYFQDAAKEVNLESLTELGIDLVRRPTGGKAVLHDDELTYSVVISQEDLPGTILETYYRLSLALIEGLRTMGIPAAMAALEHGATLRDPEFRQAACFSAPSWYEVIADGKKIIGSAQCRRNGIILQHGSIPFTLDADKVARCLGSASRERQAKVASILRAKAAGLSDILGRPVSRAELENHLIQAFRSVLGWELEPGDLTPGEIAEAEELSREKYGNRKWVMQRGRQGEDLF